MRDLMWCWMLFLWCVGLVGCSTGYTTQGLYDPSIRTVAVGIFANRTLERELEMHFTEALIKEIEHRTPYKVTRAGHADTILSGTILSVDRSTVTRNIDSALPQEMRYIITVGYEWKDLRDGRIIRKRSLQGVGRNVLTRGLGEPAEIARSEAIGDLSRHVVGSMREDW